MNRSISLFFIIMFVIGTDTFLISPMLPMLQSEFHVPTSQSGWMVSSYSLGYALFALIAGPLSDLWNRKRIMLLGLLAFAISTGLCAAAFNFWSMNAFRFAAGVSAAFVTPQVWASIPLLVPRAKVLQAMGIATAGLSVAQMLGLPLGSLLAALSWRIPFIVIGCIAVLLAALILFVLPELKTSPASSRTRAVSLFRSYKELFSSQTAAIFGFLAYFIFQFGNFSAFSFLGTWLKADFHLNITEIGLTMLFLGLGNLLGSLGGPYLILRTGRKLGLGIGLTLIAVIYPLLALSHQLWMVKGGLLLIFAICGALFPVLISYLQDLAGAARGTAAALTNTLMYLGTTLGAAAAGTLFSWTGGFLSVTILTSICFLLSSIVFVKLFSAADANRSATMQET
ncbi:MFS transporter [Paenibacillus sp. CAA11]|uniref:MFS transporter n=1 Tax=Paenibacillus sp. CAA11 TaxID=1532905 RepID=UPI000D3B6982|nr:MFS transporter [Paenibacillus sp. CAA11]AWB45903.1 MFS transporter [Paenibacillus sp. CAA11]